MVRSFLRSLPDSRLVLRGLMWASAIAGLLFVPAAFRSALRLEAEQHRNISLWIAVTPWLLMGASSLFGTVAQFEDAVFRRRVVSVVVLAIAFPAIGVAIHLWFPAFQLASSNVFSVAWALFWIPRFFGVTPYYGVGAWIDPALVRSFGPPAPAETAMRERERQIREAATQEERNRLAQDLHDSIKQEIFAIHTSAATAEAHLATDPDAAKKALEQIRTSSRDAMTEMEALLDRLNPTPLENTGLVAALKKQCEALALRTGAVVDCHIGALPESSRLPQGAHEALFRIAQEALSNIGRHARADRVRVSLELAERDLLLTIRDNGQGFELWGKEAPPPGMGIANMRARAKAVGGQLGLVTSPGKGVVLRVGIIVMSKTNFGFAEMSRGKKWLLYSFGAVIAVPVVAAVWLVVFDSEIGWEGWLAIATVVAVQLWMNWMRNRRDRKRIIP